MSKKASNTALFSNGTASKYSSHLAWLMLLSCLLIWSACVQLLTVIQSEHGHGVAPASILDITVVPSVHALQPDAA